MDRNSHRIIIIGGGFVGLTLAGRLLKHKDVSIDLIESNTDKILGFSEKIYGVNEPELFQILSQAQDENRIKFTSALPEGKSDAMFICIGTPKNQSINENLKIFCNLINNLGNSLISSGSIFLRSTVHIGTTSRLQKYIDGTEHRNLKVFYAPERTAEGVALEELDTLPQILGSTQVESLKEGSRLLENLSFKVVPVSNSETAEFIKLMCNIWRDSIFAISNEFALISESFNLNVFELIEKANLDYPRAKIPLPGPVGGPCLSKDTYILLESFPKTLSKNRLISATRILNENLEDIAINKILAYIKDDNKTIKINFLGAAFKGKPETNDFRESFTKNLVDKLLNLNLKLEMSIWDPNLFPRDLLTYHQLYVNNLMSKNSDIVVIGNNANFMFSKQVIEYLKNLSKDSLVIDMWGVINALTSTKASVYQFGNSLRI